MGNLVRARQEKTRRLVKIPRVDSDFYPFGGGLNLIDSPLSSTPGQCQNALNYEMGFEGGYKRVGGYLAFDGRPYAGRQDYYKLPVGLNEKPSFEDDIPYTDYETINTSGQELIHGKASGGMGCIVDYDQSGGYGENVLLHNQTFDPTEWDLAVSTGTLFVDSTEDRGYKWTAPNRTVESLPVLDTGTHGGALIFKMQALNDPISVRIGDILYISFLAKAWADPTVFVPNTFSTKTIQGIRLEIDNGVGDPFGLPASTPVIDFDVEKSTVLSASDHFIASGVTIISEGVKRCWCRTKICTTADTTLTIGMTMLQEDTPGVYITALTDDNARIWCGVPMAVVFDYLNSPHNFVNGRELSSTTYWDRTNLTSITDAGAAWASGVYPDFSRITENTSAAQKQFAVNMDSGGVHTPVRAVKGDRLYVEFYAQYTAANREGIIIYVNNNDGSAGFGDYFCAWNIKTGLIADYQSISPVGVESQTITNISGDIYFCTVTFDPYAFTASINSLAFQLGTETTSTDVTPNYTGASLFLDMTGIRVIIMPGTDEVELKEVVTAASTANVNTGHLILGGTGLGEDFIDGETLETVTVWQDEVNDDLYPHYERRNDCGVARGPAILNSESDSALEAQYQAAITTIESPGPTRGKTQQTSQLGRPTPVIPPGSGPVRGITHHRGFTLCMRNSSNGAQCYVWKSSGKGWRRVDSDIYAVPYDAGTGTEPVPGTHITNFANGQKGFVIKVITNTGAWGTDAAGFIWVKTSNPEDVSDWTNNGSIDVVDGATGLALIDGTVVVPDDAQTLNPGGRFEFRQHNFFGAADRVRLYWVDGKNNGYEYDDLREGFVSVITGMTDDRPTHLAVHNGHLFYGFPGGSVQLSGDGDPFSWTVITGASEIAVGDEITGFNEEVGNSLFIFTRDSSFVLQGNTRANFDLDDFNINAGAHEWSVQRIGLGMFFDDRGFTSLLQTQRTGSVNFQENAQSELIQPLVENLVSTAKVRTSHLIRKENLYRCYFDDGRIVSVGFQKHEISGHMLLEYPFIANVSTSEEGANGAERIFVGTDDGEVFELETGESFGDNPVNAFMRTVLYHSGSPGRMKKYTHARIDGTFNGALTMSGRVEYDFDDPDWNLGQDLIFDNDSAGGYWDNFEWDNFIWDKSTSGNPQEKLEGEGTNAAVYLHTTSSTDLPHTLRGITLQWMPRRDDRRT